MEIFLNVWNNWSIYEKTSISLILGISLIFLIVSVYFLTKDKMLAIWVSLSLLSSALITVLILWLLNIIFDITIVSVFIFVPFIVLFVNILSLGTSIGYYMDHKKDKNFEIVNLKKEFLRDSFQLTVFIFLMFCSLSVFLSSIFLILILVSGGISISVVWINYLLMYKLVK